MTGELLDFRGGYATDIPNHLMGDNELHVATNCHWRSLLTKRNGITKYSTSDWSGFTGCRGAIRAKINSAWVTIVALDTGAEVNFYQGAGTTFAAIDNAFDWMMASMEKAVSDRVLTAAKAALTSKDVTQGGTLASVVDALLIGARDEPFLEATYDAERAASRALRKGLKNAVKSSEGKLLLVAA